MATDTDSDRSKKRSDEKRGDEFDPESAESILSADAEHDSTGGVPDFIRRLAAVGLSGFFTTESALRKALGDTLPKEWVDFAAEQSERTRHELLDRLAGEFGKVLEQVDLGELMNHLLTGRTVEVTAQIRLGAAADDSKVTAEDSKIHITVDEA
jgi:hypothetical protein